MRAKMVAMFLAATAILGAFAVPARASAAPSWTGVLKIDLAGFGLVRPAGPGPHASMCEGLVCLVRGVSSGRSLRRRLG